MHEPSPSYSRQIPPSRMRGMSLFMMLVLLPIILLMLILAFYEGRKAYWDYRVNDMCEEDGGTYIFEQIYLTAVEARNIGLLKKNSLIIPPKRRSGNQPPYYIEYESSDIHTNTLRVSRGVTQVVRARDAKVLAKIIDYSRVGGDFPTFAHPSYKHCKNADDSLVEFRKTIIIKDTKNG